MQNYVRNLNNEIFLSEYQINNLYTLLLIGRNSPWDSIKLFFNYLEGIVKELKKKLIVLSIVKYMMSKIYWSLCLMFMRIRPRRVLSRKFKN